MTTKFRKSGTNTMSNILTEDFIRLLLCVFVLRISLSIKNTINKINVIMVYAMNCSFVTVISIGPTDNNLLYINRSKFV